MLDQEVALPEDMAGWRDETEVANERLRAEGRTPVWQARTSRGAAGRWEHRTLDYVPFRQGDVVRYMLHADRSHRWAPVAPALYHLALVHVYGRTPVERAEAQVVRRLR